MYHNITYINLGFRFFDEAPFANPHDTSRAVTHSVSLFQYLWPNMNAHVAYCLFKFCTINVLQYDYLFTLIIVNPSTKSTIIFNDWSRLVLHFDALTWWHVLFINHNNIMLLSIIVILFCVINCATYLV